MLDFSTKVQFVFLEWIRRGGLQIFPLQEIHLERIIELSQKFQDVLMDLADASLIVTSEVKAIKEIASTCIDSDFYVYRDIRNRYLTNIFM